MDITRNTRNAKNELMTYFRSESENLKSILNQKLDHKGKAKILNSKLVFRSVEQPKITRNIQA